MIVAVTIVIIVVMTFFIVMTMAAMMNIQKVLSIGGKFPAFIT